jgi:hypothetical protein
MNEPKFTPGPWKVGRPHNEDVPSAINGWNYYPIYYGNDEEQVCDIVYNKADADLIAAAPDMYAALENVCMICQLRDHETNCECCQFGKVLKKARGEA